MPESHVIESEIWRPIPGYEGRYEASSLGGIRSVARTIICGRPPREMFYPSRMIATWTNAGGYLFVRLHGDAGGQRTWFVHKAVLAAFHGPCPSGKVGCHNTNNQTDNRIGNLRYDTPTQNIADRRKHGTAPLGERSGTAKLTVAKVLEIRELVRCGETQRDVARRYGVGKTTIARIVRGETWNHV